MRELNQDTLYDPLLLGTFLPTALSKAQLWKIYRNRLFKHTGFVFMGGRNDSSLVILQSLCSDHPGAVAHMIPLEFLRHTSDTVFLGEASEVPLALPWVLKAPPKHLG